MRIATLAIAFLLTGGDIRRAVATHGQNGSVFDAGSGVCLTVYLVLLFYRVHKDGEEADITTHEVGAVVASLVLVMARAVVHPTLGAAFSLGLGGYLAAATCADAYAQWQFRKDRGY